GGVALDDDQPRELAHRRELARDLGQLALTHAERGVDGDEDGRAEGRAQAIAAAGHFAEAARKASTRARPRGHGSAGVGDEGAEGVAPVEVDGSLVPRAAQLE